MPVDLRNRVIVITGASSGIGAATAIECAKAGMDVVLNARRAGKLDEVAEQVRGQGRRCAVVVGGVEQEGLSEQLLDAAEEHFGRFHAVFANAGYGIEKPIVDLQPAELREIFDVNFFASLDLIQHAARRLLARKQRGHLLMCSSCLAKFSLPYYAAYSATKAAQHHFCRAMKLELEPHGIYVSCVHPITTKTEFHEVSRQRSGLPEAERLVPEHSPRLFVQPSRRVARAVVKCLRKPKPEVWTSHIVRFVAGSMTMFPGLYDLFMRKQAQVGHENHRVRSSRPD